MISPEKTKHWCNSIPRRQGFICCVVLSILNVETLRHKAYSFESFTVLTYLECNFHIHSWILYCRSNVQNGIMFFSKFDVFLVSVVFQLLEDSRLEPQKVTHFGKENHLQYLHIWVPYLYNIYTCICIHTSMYMYQNIHTCIYIYLLYYFSRV